MGNINLLPPSVYNRIAAGEVVDRPYSVVKELVENAIDAGAKNIEIRIERGGKDRIQVIDDGSGILYDDLKSAFLPHATSKIASAEDLNTIHTLGFRGEALASIASVAKVTISSRTAEGKGYRISCDGGELSEIVECGIPKGTEVDVQSLFFHTPVRQKFLKSDRTEESDITNFVARFLLSHPEIAFSFFADGKKVYQSFGGSLSEAIVAVYGPKVLDQCFELDAVKNGLHIRGFIGNTNFSKPNRTYQSTFVNGRYVINLTLQSAIQNAYNSYLMKRQYPFYVLFVDMPAEIVDVNVHPNKADVRFANNQVVYGALYSVVSAVLDGSAKALEYLAHLPGEVIPPPTVKSTFPEAAAKSEPSQADLNNPSDTPAYFHGGSGAESAEVRSSYPHAERVADSAGGASYPRAERDSERAGGVSATEQPTLTYRQALAEIRKASPVSESGQNGQLGGTAEGRAPAAQAQTPSSVGAGNVPRPVRTGTGFEPIFHENTLSVQDSSYAPPAKKDVFAENQAFLRAQEEKKGQQKLDTSSFVYKGNLFNTYLIYEHGEEVYLIDQHAAHERLIFDRLKEQMSQQNNAMQPMLFPYLLDVNLTEADFLSQNLPQIRAIGFEIDEFGGNSFKVSAVPVILQDIDLDAFFREILSDISGLKGIRLNDLLRDKFAMAACKAAVKGGMNLTDQEVKSLWKKMDGNLGLKCPHGRPVTVKLTKSEIEKMFKRIV